MVQSPLLHWLFSDDQNAVLYECRNCGRTLDEDVELCPECESESIAEYRL